MITYILAWFPMLIIAIVNGAVRETTYAKAMPELRAHQLSTLTGSILIGLFIWFVIRRWPPSSEGQALLLGLVWLLFTVVFEFFMGLALRRRPLSQVLEDYNLLAGHVWVLFLIWVALAPWLFFRLQNG